MRRRSRGIAGRSRRRWATRTGCCASAGTRRPGRGRTRSGWRGGGAGTAASRTTARRASTAATPAAGGHTPLDRRLYPPAAWFTPAYAGHRRPRGSPRGTPSRTGHALAGELVAAAAAGTPRARWVVCDGGYGDGPAGLDRRAAAWAARVPADRWRRYRLLAGSKGPLVAGSVAVRRVAVRDRPPGPPGWLLVRRGVPVDPEGAPVYEHYPRDAPADTAPATLARVSGLRWPLAACCAEARQEAGLDHDATRPWRGWPHRLTLAILARHSLVRPRQRRNPREGGPCACPPLPSLNPQGASEPIAAPQRHPYAAYPAHRQRRCPLLADP